VIDVHDGDTVRLDVDCGFRMWFRGPFRLRGINAPELPTPEGVAARDALSGKLPATVRVVTYPDPEKYGRWLGDIYAGDLFLNQWMVDNGFAVPYSGGARLA
jgi:micrococcal nuclease